MSSGLRIGVVARSAGVSVDTIRHYGRLGLLPELPRAAGGARRYPESALRRVQVIQAALAVGFTLKELAWAFTERRAGRAPCLRVRGLATEKLAAVDRRVEELQRLREALHRALSDWESRLSRGQPAGLLDALADVPITTRVHETPRRKTR
jgi:DNA-binding transcriptional MerR regulator